MASVKVAVRVRPFNKRERMKDSALIVEMHGNRTSLRKPNRPSLSGGGDASHHSGHKSRVDNNTYDFTYDYSYWSFGPADGAAFATQRQVYEDLGRDVIDCAYQGYNACVFAYGQTGSGKTYTMMGTAEEPGLIPQTCRALFARQRNSTGADACVGAQMMTGYKTTVSYLEIYNERVKDLLDTSGRGHVLKIREHQVTGPYVENLSQHVVTDYAEIQAFIDRGNRLRTTASTNMNDTSSRSHAIFTITFTQAGFIKAMPSETVSKIHLVDLAGSERADATGATGQRLKEGAHINKSLVTLGSVISALSEQAVAAAAAQTNNNQSGGKPSAVYIPYRDSVLTWLLKDSLGGNSKTIMIAAISPADCNYTETLSTLRYANRAKNIINTPTINEDANVKLIRELREEIQKLKGMLTTSSVSASTLSSSSAAALASSVASARVLEDLKRKEAQEKELTDEWTEKWSEVQAILREQKALGLRMSGAGVVLDSKRPHLIGIPDDKQTGVTLYSLLANETLIGTTGGGSGANGNNGDATVARIVLSGENMLAEHCVIRLDANGHRATIEPHPNALCWLNRTRINEPTAICQGDLLVLGGTNVFRYNNPAEAAALKDSGGGGGGSSSGDGAATSTTTTRMGASSRLDLSRLSLASTDHLFSSIICNSEDELSFVCPLREQATDNNSPPANQRARNRRSLQISPNWDVDSLKQLNAQEREMLARREQAYSEKSALEKQIDEQSECIRAIESQLERFNSSDTNENRAADAAAAGSSSSDSLHTLEHRLVQTEMQLAQCSSSLTALNDEIHGLEMDHYSLIVTRRRLENEALRFNSLPHGWSASQRAKSLMQLSLTSSLASGGAHSATGAATVPQTPTSPMTEDHAIGSGPKRPQQQRARDKAAAMTTFDRSQSMERSSDGGISSQSSADLAPHARDVVVTAQSPLATRLPTSDDSTPDESDEAVENDDDDEDVDRMYREVADARSNLPVCCRMHALRTHIAYEKATLMKNLEVNTEKRVLDEGIDRLQELQRRYVDLEMRLTKTAGSVDGCDDGKYAVCQKHQAQHQEELQQQQRLQQQQQQLTGGSTPSTAPTLAMSRNASNVCVTRSMQSIVTDSEYAISIPGYVMCGSGSDAHYEYEITINLDTDTWSILRRYSRFREMHLAMKRQYGDAIADIPFPRRQIFFPQTEAVAFRRRRLLEIYLRRLIVVCSKLPGAAIYEDEAGAMQGTSALTRASLVAFAPFFRKGVCECGQQRGADVA